MAEDCPLNSHFGSNDEVAKVLCDTAMAYVEAQKPPKNGEVFWHPKTPNSLNSPFCFQRIRDTESLNILFVWAANDWQYMLANGVLRYCGQSRRPDFGIREE